MFHFAYKMTFASFWLIFNQKLANVPPGQNVGKRTLPQIWGALVSRVRMMWRPGCQSAIVVRSMDSRFVILVYLLADLIEIWIPTLVKMGGTVKALFSLLGYSDLRRGVSMCSAIPQFRNLKTRITAFFVSRF